MPKQPFTPYRLTAAGWSIGSALIGSLARSLWARRWWLSVSSVLGLLWLLAWFTPLFSELSLWLLSHQPIELNQTAANAHRLAPYGLSLTGLSNPKSTPDASLLIENPVLEPRVPAITALPLRVDPSALERQVGVVQLSLPVAYADVNHQRFYTAQAIVILGGGLSTNRQGQIIPNRFTDRRYDTALQRVAQTGLPLVISGAEAPYIERWLHPPAWASPLLEPSSMNTCENARFTALLLQQQGGTPRVELVTDAWHMPRARRLFASNGLETTPVIAPLPNDPPASAGVQLQRGLWPYPPVTWWPSPQNLIYSSRAMHELIATARDLWFGETNCREVP